MQFKRLGRTGVSIPEIGFGTWNYTAGPGPLRALIDRGPCFIDTAETYGNESVVGEAMRGFRDRVFLATKVRPRNFRRRDLIAAAERSLRLLETDAIDLYQLHWPNETVPIAETMQAMAELTDSGKIRFIGVSNFSVNALEKAENALAKISGHRIVSNQLRYSLIDRTIERELFSYCYRSSVTILAFSPLGSGLAQLRAHDPQGVLPRIAGKFEKTVAQVALNWVICKENVVAITKASTPERIAENCAASDWRLTQTALQLLDNRVSFRERGPIELALRRAARAAFQLAGQDL